MWLGLLAIAPALIIALLVVLHDRYEPEPRWRLVAAFLTGGLAVGLALLLYRLVGDTGPLLHATRPLDRLLAWILCVGVIEESAKLVAVAPFVISREADEPVDFIVYAVLVAVGFAAVENVHYLLQHGAAINAGRAVMSVPAHAVFGTLMGALLHHAQQRTRGLGYCLLALLVPAVVHGAWDFMVSMPAPWHLVFVPFHLALIVTALLVLESTALRSPFRFQPRSWNRSPIHAHPDMAPVALGRRLALDRWLLWAFHLLGIAVPTIAVAMLTPDRLGTIVTLVAGILALLALVHAHRSRDRRLIDFRQLVPGEVGGLPRQRLASMVIDAARGLRLPARTRVRVVLDDPGTGVRHDWRRPARDRAHLEALPLAACRLLEDGELAASVAQRLALHHRLGRLPVLGWAAPIIVTMTVALLAIQAGGLIAFIALLLWPALLVPFRLLETRLLDRVIIGAVHLADLDAARVAGLLPLVNAMLKLGARADRQLVIEAHARDLAGILELEPETLETLAAASDRPSVLDDTTLGHLSRQAGREAVRSLDADDDGSGDGAATGRGGAGPPPPPDHDAAGDGDRQATLRARVRRIDWRRFDSIVRDGRLDRVELGALIDALRDAPERPLFASGAFPEGAHSTPTIRDRLLFVAAHTAAPPSPARGNARPAGATAGHP
ncbi:MAG: PrsW family glutamic-type intramembrane protease [Candidatus Eiseniibacteriota bacterium]|jgi:RsiW-degrading membrane proteinase PrsW (M82 family)